VAVPRFIPKRKRVIDDSDEEQLRMSEKADLVLKTATMDELAQLDTQQHSLPLSPPLRPKSVIDDAIVRSEDEEHRHDDSSSALHD
jgi:hypothetical protein